MSMIEGFDAVPFYKKYTNPINDEIKKFIPISIVACLENFFKAICKDLIDHGEPFISNVKNFNKHNIHFNFDIVTAIGSETITMGEFISHILPFNNLHNINSNLSTILQNDFLNSLKYFKRESIFDHVNEIQKQFIDNQDQIIKDVKHVFELRHMFCHEYNPEYDLSTREVKRIFSNCVKFQEYIELYISEMKYPNSPETQAEITGKAYQSLNKANEELDTLIQQIKASFLGEDNFRSLDEQLFNEMVDSWKNYKDKRAHLFGEEIGQGTLRSTVESYCQETVVKEFIESLKKSFPILEGKVLPDDD